MPDSLTRERIAKLRSALAAAPFDAFLAVSAANILYATGYRSMGATVFGQPTMGAFVTGDRSRGGRPGGRLGARDRRLTTVRDPGCFINELDFLREEADRSARNDIAAPRISPYVGFGEGHPARSRPRPTAAHGLARWPAAAPRASSSSATEQHLPSRTARGQPARPRLGLPSPPGYTAQATALDSARWGLSSIQHFYGLPEAMPAQGRQHRYPLDYNYQNEVQRFADAGTVWAQAAEPGSRQWNDLLDELVSTSVVLDPTLKVYIGLRDAARVQNSEWHND